MEELVHLLLVSTLETLVMVGVAAPLAAVFGLILGVLLVITSNTGISPSPLLHRFLSTVINFGRSVPFIITIVAVVPFTRLVTGTSIGTKAAIVPLVIGAIPYVARLIESALLEVDQGIIEAVSVMGASPWQIVRNAYLPEALPALIRAFTIMVVTLVSYSAMAGAVGGGGLGDLAIRYGYQRFRPDVMISTVLVLVILVQSLQSFGDRLAKTFDKR